MIGLVDRERVDAALYDDYETDKAREVCLIPLIYIGFVILVYCTLIHTVWLGGLYF